MLGRVSSPSETQSTTGSISTRCSTPPRHRELCSWRAQADTPHTPVPGVVVELNNSRNKTYLVCCRSTKVAALIDPEDEHTGLYMSTLTYHGLRLRYVIDTHSHADHISGLRRLSQLTAAETVMHVRSPTPRIDVHVEDGDLLEIGEIQMQVLWTPGHTRDSISLYLPTCGCLFSGDVLLIRGTGRCDIGGGDAGESYDSVMRLLNHLPPDTILYPSHDYRGRDCSTLGEEAERNPRIAGVGRDAYVKMMGELFSPMALPRGVMEALQANQSGLPAHQQSLMDFPNLQDIARVKQVSPSDLWFALWNDDPPPLLLDIREPFERSQDGFLENSVCVPLKDLATVLSLADRLHTAASAVASAAAGGDIIAREGSGKRRRESAGDNFGVLGGGFGGVFQLSNSNLDEHLSRMSVSGGENRPTLGHDNIGLGFADDFEISGTTPELSTAAITAANNSGCEYYNGRRMYGLRQITSGNAQQHDSEVIQQDIQLNQGASESEMMQQNVQPSGSDSARIQQSGKANQVVVPEMEMEEIAKAIFCDKYRPLVTVCRVGCRSNSAAAMLLRHGFRHVANLTGGVVEWRMQGFPVLGG